MIFSGFRSKPLLAFQIHQKNAVTGDVLVPSTVGESVLHLDKSVGFVLFVLPLIYLSRLFIYLVR